jgi:hypothetical protein
MRTLKYLLVGGFVLAFSLLLGNSGPGARSADEENHCFTCHTNARKLIKITREIAAAKKDQPKAEVASEGEG